MESADVEKIVSVGQKSKVCKPYVAPKFENLSPEAAKDRLLQNADANDSELRQMIEIVDELHGAKGS